MLVHVPAAYDSHACIIIATTITLCCPCSRRYINARIMNILGEEYEMNCLTEQEVLKESIQQRITFTHLGSCVAIIGHIHQDGSMLKIEAILSMGNVNVTLEHKFGQHLTVILELDYLDDESKTILETPTWLSKHPHHSHQGFQASSESQSTDLLFTSHQKFKSSRWMDLTFGTTTICCAPTTPTCPGNDKSQVEKREEACSSLPHKTQKGQQILCSDIIY
ncbi:hypothetical protein EDD18DRAFT_1105687 [Armillaria luteobubalina]|uniref:Uncharacterized protein n=1 Tax=Armillaria luteobubalina TaxID=153913 RepID=A0AA39Q6N8_9AGAR|nr:hypothetical protein EDD18DRAFT_1105687 [Armillaria luteobubalina]